MRELRVSVYAREIRPREPDPEPFLYQAHRWRTLEEILGTDADAIAVAFPEVLGDTYTEILVNLGKVAESGKMLMIKDPSPYLREVKRM